MEFVCKHYNELSIDELYDFLALRQKIFIVEQDCPYLDADEKDKLGWHLMIWEEEKLVAYTRLLDAGISYDKYCSIGRVVCDESHRGQGTGRLLMTKSIEECLRLFPNKKIKISAQVYLLHFYESLGFQEIGERYLEDGIPHTAMIFINL